MSVTIHENVFIHFVALWCILYIEKKKIAKKVRLFAFMAMTLVMFSPRLLCCKHQLGQQIYKQTFLYSCNLTLCCANAIWENWHLCVSLLSSWEMHHPTSVLGSKIGQANSNPPRAKFKLDPKMSNTSPNFWYILQKF